MEANSFNDVKEKISSAAFSKRGNCFLLIDASLKDYQTESFLSDTLRDYKSYSIIFHHKQIQGALPLYLFPLDKLSEKDDRLFNNSIQHSLSELKQEKLEAGEGRSVCAWISTNLAGEQLAEQIALTTVQPTQSVGNILIRYFDPSVFGLLIPVLDKWQKEQLLSNINTWSYLNGDGVVHTMNGDGECRKKLNHSLGLTDRNVSEINFILFINKILRVYRNTNTIHKLSECEAGELLRPALAYYYSSFSPSESDVIEFGLDVLSAERLFYLDGLLFKYMLNRHSKEYEAYKDIKTKIDNLIH
ncbi:DUF4123 domain-containing protein [Enterobacter bugandensis]|uniref:DUF4123 domain-containing protein n=1 Tax=Enterobacter bugandensis TaxID=881260 RepID=UPI00066532D6|nr:DUF4123 domain-containing protein [Enterobacter bugandensis]